MPVAKFPRHVVERKAKDQHFKTSEGSITQAPAIMVKPMAIPIQILPNDQITRLLPSQSSDLSGDRIRVVMVSSPTVLRLTLIIVSHQFLV